VSGTPSLLIHILTYVYYSFLSPGDSPDIFVIDLGRVYIVLAGFELLGPNDLPACSYRHKLPHSAFISQPDNIFCMI
jgi:hypothetical protein